MWRAGAVRSSAQAANAKKTPSKRLESSSSNRERAERSRQQGRQRKKRSHLVIRFRRPGLHRFRRSNNFHRRRETDRGRGSIFGCFRLLRAPRLDSFPVETRNSARESIHGHTSFSRFSFSFGSFFRLSPFVNSVRFVCVECVCVSIARANRGRRSLSKRSRSRRTFFL